VTFEGQENITAHPAPMKSVDLRIQRVSSRIFGWVFVIDFRAEADMKTDFFVMIGRDVPHLKTDASRSHANIFNAVALAQPSAIAPKQSQIRDQEIQTRYRDTLTCRGAVGQRVKSQRHSCK